MNPKLSASALALLGSFIAAKANASKPINTIETRSIEAAALLSDLENRGLVRIDKDSGTVLLNGSVLEVLRRSGWVGELKPTTEMSTRTYGTSAGNPEK